MFKYIFRAINSDNDEEYSKKIVVNNLQEFMENWLVFVSIIPYDDWFSDNECVDGDESWLERIED